MKKNKVPPIPTMTSTPKVSVWTKIVNFFKKIRKTRWYVISYVIHYAGGSYWGTADLEVKHGRLLRSLLGEFRKYVKRDLEKSFKKEELPKNISEAVILSIYEY